MALHITAVVGEDHLHITARSMGGGVVGVVRHPRSVGLAMSTLVNKCKQLALENNFIAAEGSVQLVGKNSQLLQGNTVLWTDPEFKDVLGKELASKRRKISPKTDPRVSHLALYIDAGD